MDQRYQRKNRSGHERELFLIHRSVLRLVFERLNADLHSAVIGRALLAFRPLGMVCAPSSDEFTVCTPQNREIGPMAKVAQILMGGRNGGDVICRINRVLCDHIAGA